MTTRSRLEKRHTRGPTTAAATNAGHQGPRFTFNAGTSQWRRIPGIGGVVGQGVVVAVLQRRWVRRRQHAEAEPRERVPDRDEVTGIPVTTGEDQTPDPPPSCAPAPAAGGQRDRGERECPHRTKQVQFHRQRQPGRDGGDDAAAAVRPRVGRGHVGGAHPQSEGRHDKEHAKQIVVGGSGITVEHHRRRHDERRRQHEVEPNPRTEPRHQAASNVSASHMRLMPGESTSLPINTMPSAWNSSEVAGYSPVSQA